MEMKTFSISLRASIDSIVQIEAKDESEARDKAQDTTIDELTYGGNYVDCWIVVKSCEEE